MTIYRSALIAACIYCLLNLPGCSFLETWHGDSKDYRQQQIEELLKRKKRQEQKQDEEVPGWRHRHTQEVMA